MNEPFFKNHIYHIFNRGHNKQKIIFTEGNYIYLLKKKILTFNGVKILVYCLMPNHYHFLLQQMTERPQVELWVDKEFIKCYFSTLAEYRQFVMDYVIEQELAEKLKAYYLD